MIAIKVAASLLLSITLSSVLYNSVSPNGSPLLVQETVKTPASSIAQKEQLKARNAPPIQVFDICDYNDVYLDILKELNKIRYGSDDIFSLCMNRKLMWAAKIQSDFQALVDEPTHSGPRVCKLGSVEERVEASTFQHESGLAPPEEIIYHWPVYPTEWPGAAAARREFIRKAMMEILEDKSANATLMNPGYRFFGAAITRKNNGRAFLTLLMADSKFEQCHVCYRLANGKIAPKPKSV